MRLLWLADVLRSRGLVVVEVAGWQTRGAEMDPIGGVVGHHTASAIGSGECPSLGIVINGRGEPNPLPGPLAQILLGRSGACYVVAAGKANHAGLGSYSTIPANAGGNGHLIGIEAENSGLGEPWTMPQMRAYVLLVAALLDHEHLAYDRFCSHYEWAKPIGRKIDPAGPWLGGGDWYSGGQWTGVNRTATANDFRHRVRVTLESWSDDLTPAEHDLLVQAAADAAYTKHLMDDVVRPKMDAIYVDTHGDDHPDLLAGRVKALAAGTAPPKV